MAASTAAPSDESFSANESDLAELESYTHPAIRATIARHLAASGNKVVAEIPILNEWLSSWPRVVVEAPLEIRVARLKERGMTIEEIADRMGSQPKHYEWRAAADFVLDNGEATDLEGELDRLERWMASRGE